MTEPIRIVIAEDQPFVRTSLSLLLGSTPGMEVVGEAEDGQRAVELARSLKPDVLLLDCMLPNLDGIEAVRQIKHELPAVRVIGHSWREDAELVRAFLDAGAAAFVSKSAHVTVLIDVIRGGAGDAPLDPGDETPQSPATLPSSSDGHKCRG